MKRPPLRVRGVNTELDTVVDETDHFHAIRVSCEAMQPWLREVEVEQPTSDAEFVTVNVKVNGAEEWFMHTLRVYSDGTVSLSATGAMPDGGEAK